MPVYSHVDASARRARYLKLNPPSSVTGSAAKEDVDTSQPKKEHPSRRGAYTKRGRSSSSHSSYGLSKRRSSNSLGGSTTKGPAVHSPTWSNVPVITDSNAAKPAKSLSTPAPSVSCITPLPVVSDTPVQSPAVSNKQDIMKVRDASKVDGTCIVEEDATASHDSECRKIKRLTDWHHLFPEGTLREAVGPPIRAMSASAQSGGKMDDALRDDILGSLFDIATSMDPVSREIKIKDVWRKSLGLVVQHIATFETRTWEMRKEITYSKSHRLRYIAKQRMRTHLTAMQIIREFFQAYPEVMREDLEWRDYWKRIKSGKPGDSLGAATPAESDLQSTASVDDPNRPVCIDNATSLPSFGKNQYDSESGDVGSPEIQVSTNGQKSSIVDEVRSVNSIAGNDAASLGNGRPAVANLESPRSAKSPTILISDGAHSRSTPVLSSPPISSANNSDAGNTSEKGEMYGVQNEATASNAEVSVKSKRPLPWKQLFPDAALRAAIRIPIRAVFACGDAWGRADDTLHREILEDLSNIANPAEPTTQQIQIEEVWRKTLKLVTQRLAIFESRNAAIRSEISSATSDEARSRAILKMAAHQTSMLIVRNFLRSYPGVTGQAIEWRDICRRISGELHDPLNTTLLPAPGSSITHLSDISAHTSPNDERRLPQQDEIKELDGKAVVTLSHWKKLILPTEQRQEVGLLVPLIVVLRNCGVGSPQEYEEPLRLLRSLQGSQPSETITTAVQELSRYTRDFVERHRATISEKHAELLRRFSGVELANSASILWKPGERAYVTAVLQAFKRMNDFLDAYPEAKSSRVDVAQIVGLTAWKMSPMNPKQFNDMRCLIPVYLSYFAVGITGSNYFGIASRILRDYNKAKTDSERNAKIRELVTTTIKFIEEHEPVLRNKLSSAQKLRKQANTKEKDTPLDKRISRLRNATALTTQLRRKYLALISYSGETPAAQSSGNAEIGQPSNNTDEACDAGSQQVYMPQPKLERETKLVRAYSAETNGEWIKARTSAGDRFRTEKLAESKIRSFQVMPAGSVELGTNDDSQPSTASVTATHVDHDFPSHLPIQKHKPQRPALVAISRDGQQHPGHKPTSAFDETETSNGFLDDRQAPVLPEPQIRLSQIECAVPEKSNSIGETAQQTSSLLETALSKVQHVVSKVTDLARIEKKGLAERQQASESHLPSGSAIDATVIGTLSRQLTAWFGGSDIKKESPAMLVAKGDLGEDETLPGPPSTDWNAIGYHHYGHWLAGRLGKLDEREAAHVVGLLPLNDQTVFGRQGALGLWRNEICKDFDNLAAYSGEVNDERIRIHLEEVTPTSDEISISSTGKWQMLEARRLQKRLKEDTSVLEVTTMGSLGIDAQGRLHGCGEILVGSIRPMRESCEMGPYVETTSEVELAAILRGLQMARDTFQDRGDSAEFRQYRRLIVATSSIMGLRAVAGARAHGQDESELKKTTRIAALCRMQAVEIMKSQQNIESVHFIWMPPSAGNNSRS